MENKDFDLNEFRETLAQLENELQDGITKDSEYGGELDEVLGSLKRLKTELKDEKYQRVLPDIFNVLQFLNIVEENFDEDEDEDEFEDDEEVEFEDEDEK